MTRCKCGNHQLHPVEDAFLVVRRDGIWRHYRWGCRFQRAETVSSPAERALLDLRDAPPPSPPETPAPEDRGIQIDRLGEYLKRGGFRVEIVPPASPASAPSRGSGEPHFFDKTAADALAREVAKLVDRGVIDARSPAGDALLDYVNPGPTESIVGKLGIDARCAPSPTSTDPEEPIPMAMCACGHNHKACCGGPHGICEDFPRCPCREFRAPSTSPSETR